MQRKILQGDEEKRDGVYYEYDPFSKPIGEGGMGVVYKGFRINASSGARQVVAIKAMKDYLPDEVYGRGCREANIRMKNDNLIEMMGFISNMEQEQGGRPIRRYYVVSEFLNGVVLTDLLKGNFKNCDGIEVPFAKQLYTDYITDKEKTSVKIIKRVLAGIMALHDKGYIHRDIDPSNIMVTKEGNLKMIDFGIAKYVGELGTQDSLKTSDGKFIGKAEYAPPELVLGSVKDQHYTTDIYAIGILFFQLLVGRLPFDGPQYDILQAQLKKKLPVGKVPYRKYRPIIKKATEKRQSERYQSCVEMRHAIDNPTIGLVDWNKLLKIAAGVAVVCVVGYGVSSGVIQKLKSNNPDPVPVPPYEKKSDDPIPIIDPFEKPFAKALVLLDSGNKETVKKGWEEMRKLANSGYEKAMCEVGITLCPVENMWTETIKKRRTILKLGELDQKESIKESIKMLQSIENSKDITGEGLAALGIGLFRKGDEKAATEAFNRAKTSLSPRHPLYVKVEDYLKKLSNK